MACCMGLKRPRSDLDLNGSPTTLLSKRRRPIDSPSTSTAAAVGSNLPLAVQQQNQKIIFTPFGGDGHIPELRSDAIANQIREEMKRFQNRRQLIFGNNDCNNGTVTSPSGWPSLGFPPIAIQNNGVPTGEKPLFTFEQVHQICGRMLQDRENVLRESFQNILSAKLNEQYETFVKFAQDQMRDASVSSGRNAGPAEPSYLS